MHGVPSMHGVTVMAAAISVWAQIYRPTWNVLMVWFDVLIPHTLPRQVDNALLFGVTASSLACVLKRMCC